MFGRRTTTLQVEVDIVRNAIVRSFRELRDRMNVIYAIETLHVRGIDTTMISEILKTEGYENSLTMRQHAVQLVVFSEVSRALYLRATELETELSQALDAGDVQAIGAMLSKCQNAWQSYHDHTPIVHIFEWKLNDTKPLRQLDLDHS